MGVIEFLENVTLDSSGAVEAKEPYPGFVTAENGTVRYFGKVNDKALLVVNTTNIEMAAYLIKNLKVYPKNQENTMIASTVVRGLQS